MNIPNSLYHRRRFPSEIIAYAVFAYHRFALSLRDVEDLRAERGMTVSYETIRVWCAHLGPKFASRLRKRQFNGGDHWYLDEMHLVTVRAERQVLWRVVDQDGDTLDILVQKTKRQTSGAAVFPQTSQRRRRQSEQTQHRQAAQLSGRKTRRHAERAALHRAISEQLSRSFARANAQSGTTDAKVQFARPRARFLAVHDRVQNLFRLERHLTRAANFRILRHRAFGEWQQVTCA